MQEVSLPRKHLDNGGIQIRLTAHKKKNTNDTDHRGTRDDFYTIYFLVKLGIFQFEVSLTTLIIHTPPLVVVLAAVGHLGRGLDWNCMDKKRGTAEAGRTT